MNVKAGEIHGTNASYTHGCRCEACTEARREYQREYRERGSVAVDEAYTLPTLIVPMGEWRARAACRGMNTAMFYPERGESTAEARAVCASCPVQQDCLDWALANNDTHGVWGGVSGRGRRGMDRVMPCVGCGTPVNVGRNHVLKARCSARCAA